MNHMNYISVNAQFSISTEEAVKLKFENRLDDIVKDNLARKLMFEIIENNLLDLQSIENNLNNFSHIPEITFKAKLLVCKEK